MNKHIFEFDKQAQEYAAMELATVNTGGVAEFNRLYRNKFAKLIVKKCIDLSQRFGESGDGYTIAYVISEHFGVKK
jgi:hypothetical protein